MSYIWRFIYLCLSKSYHITTVSKTNIIIPHTFQLKLTLPPLTHLPTTTQHSQRQSNQHNLLPPRNLGTEHYILPFTLEQAATNLYDSLATNYSSSERELRSLRNNRQLVNQITLDACATHAIIITIITTYNTEGGRDLVSWRLRKCFWIFVGDQSKLSDLREWSSKGLVGVCMYAYTHIRIRMSRFSSLECRNLSSWLWFKQFFTPCIVRNL